MIDQHLYGVCFFPEHWPRKTYLDDIKRIVDSGMNFVRIGEGAWWYFEPEEGQYRFDLFDDVLDLCRQNNLKVLFGTPTYCGPAWIGQKYPEVYRWNFNRVPMKHGSRRNYNYTSPAYLDLSDKIVTALAQHYKKDKSIFAWQIDNEFNCHMDVSYAPTDTIAFRVWLRNRYRTLDALNDAWGTKFWSQVYSDWDQIDLPHPTATYNNPTQVLDETRFISDTVCAFAARQTKILRAANPKWDMTHNGLFGHIDGVKLTEELDYFSHDQYPLFWDKWTGYASPLVQARSLSFPFGLLEQQAGPGGQQGYLLRSPRPGQMQLFAHQSIAHGAKMLSYFCWRTCPWGTEQHWHGLVDHDGKGTRYLKEAVQLGQQTKNFPADFWDAPPEKSVAILRDFDNETNERRINSYVKGVGWEPGHWMASLFKAHIPVDQVWPTSDWAGYRIVIAPHNRMVDPQLVAKYTKFVEAGGTLVLGAQSGIKNRDLHMVQQTAPGPLRKLAGVEVAEWSNMNETESHAIAFDNGTTLRAVGFAERLKLRGAEALATWSTDDALLTGGPAITLNRVGRGRVIYVGCYVKEDATDVLTQWLLDSHDLTPPVDAGPDVEVIVRRSARARYIYLLNHSAEPQFIQRVPAGRDLIGGKDVVDGKLKLGAWAAALIESKQPATTREAELTKTRRNTKGSRRRI